MRQVLGQSACTWALAIACLSASSGTAWAQTADKPAATPDEPKPSENVIVVSGVRQSIESAIDDKRRSTEIKDSITAEDIGQLANDNISEALQRIAGVQVNRSDDGEGRGVQIRGLSENNVQLNGETISGTAAERGVNFQDLGAELFSGVEILKSPTADAIEGSLGGTINLKTRAPLDGKKDFVFNATATQKHAEIGRLWNQDASVLAIKQFRDTPIGDIGVLVNFGYKETASVAEVYGGGDFEEAPAIWIRKTGADVPQNNPTSTNANFNFFFQPTISGQANPYRYDLAEDPNKDGVSDSNDIYYIPGQFGFFERTRDDTKKSFNGSLEWKPANNLRIRFDTVLTDIEENLTGANYSINFNVPRAGPLIGGPGNVYTKLEDTPALGSVYYLQSGRIASATNRVGAAPSVNTVNRKSQQYSLEATWDVTSSLTFYAKGSTSRGKANTDIQAQLSTGIEQQGGANTTFNAQDFYNFVDFDQSQGKIPNVTFYEDPFPSPAYGVNAVVAPTALKALNPADINYVRQRYFQYQRNASDTKNRDDSVRFDLTWDPGSSFFKAFKLGGRWAERSFQRAVYQNPNQNAGVFTAFDGVRAPAQLVNIQRIPVNPASTTDAGAAATSVFLQPCINSAGRAGLLAQFDSNLPRVFGSTAGCDLKAVEAYFNLIDIRAVNPATGAGYYEQVAQRFDVSEETLAAYLRADFSTTFSGIDLFGNVGVRYVKTKTTSGGYIPSATTTGAFDTVKLPGKYDDWLPSANLNFALTRDIILRAAYTRSLGRPGLSIISPGLSITRSDVDPNFDGFGTAGNPDLEPVHSNNFDASLEWYYDKGSFVSVAAFMKNIDPTIFLGSAQVPLQIGNEVFAVRTYDNFGGTKIKGIELGMAHAFNYLPGFLSHLGVTANYTIVDESSDLVDQEGDPVSRRDLSTKAANLGAYYDDGKFSARLAYNWRSDFTRRENVALGFARPETLPETEAARDQLDLALRYKVNKNIRFTFNAINLTNTGTFRYIKYPQLVNYLAYAGRKYNFGVSVSF
ncbi:TonB-dependent receptor [Novosphingobium sp. Gsoil 351]|uniref:TonB-dependent receptor n=1 Tax=Novosphingobium sp. Gsoil 351 TaxID=2675225 RepID=UPI001E4101D9|nr:TonB-dependent receptor [Novosphingobium sp. Gsoil 351]